MDEANAVLDVMMLWGAGCFGAVIGWYLYYVNRWRSGEVKIGDLVTVIGAIGGAAILRLFPAGTTLFGAYGIGLAVGFFGYFLVLLAFVLLSRTSFGLDWFLDGRSKLPVEPWGYPGGNAPRSQIAMGEGERDGGVKT